MQTVDVSKLTASSAWLKWLRARTRKIAQVIIPGRVEDKCELELELEDKGECKSDSHPTCPRTSSRP